MKTKKSNFRGKIQKEIDSIFEEYWTYLDSTNLKCSGQVINTDSVETYTKYRCMKQSIAFSKLISIFI